jgi:DNA-binding response OmpR family regulator/predicted ATPase
VDLVTGQVQGPRAGLTLTTRERALLAYLAAHPSRDVPREELLTEVWGYSEQVLTRTIDTTVRRLREKIERDPTQPTHLLTAFGVGYRFEPLRQEQDAPSAPTTGRRWLVLGERRVDLDAGQVHTAEGEVGALTTSERTVLEKLAARAGAVVEVEELVRLLWGPGLQRARPLHSMLYRLRKKLEPDPDEPRYLLTVRGSGLRLMLDAGPSGHTVGTLVQVRPDPAAVLGEPAQMAALVAELEQGAREAGGVPAGDGWTYLFADPEAARRWAQAVLARHGRLSVGLCQGPVVWWSDPSTGRTLCAGPAVLRSQELVAQAEPGTVVDEGRAPGEQFVGRKAELDLLERALSRPGLVTLVGAGGIGKTTLARRAAAVFSGPTAFCALGEATTGLEVARQVARALDLTLQGPAETQVGQVLAARGELLVVLDPWRGPAGLLQRWLEAAPEARFLLTSPSPLGLQAEQVIEVGPLSPSEAGRMLAARAHPERPAPADELQGLADRLQGVPLALELAAARLGTHSPQEVLQQLQQTLLGPRGGPAPPAEAVQSALQWSWAQLSAAERSVLAQLSVFQGGFDAAAVEGVCRSPGPFVLDVLGALLDRSLVWTWGSRFGLLDPVRDFARTQLEAPEEVQERHARWYTRWSARMQKLRRWSEQTLEFENLVAACRWATARGEEMAVDAVMGVNEILKQRGPVELRLELLRPVLELSALPWPAQKRAAEELVDALRSVGQVQEGAELAQRWLARAREQGDGLWSCKLLQQLALCELPQGRAEEARGHLQEALELARVHPELLGRVLGAAAVIECTLGDFVRAEQLLRESVAQRDARQATSLTFLGGVLSEMGRNDEAYDCCMEALAMVQQDGDLSLEAYLRSNLAPIEASRGRLEMALTFAQRARELHHQVGNPRSEGLAMAWEAEALARLGRGEEAVARSEEAVALHRRLQLPLDVAKSLYGLGTTLRLVGASEEAVRVLSQALELARETGQILHEGVILAELALLQPREAEARAWALRAAELAGSVQSAVLVGVAWQAMAATSAGPEEALEPLERAEAGYASCDPMMVGLVRCERAEHLLVLGRLDEARAQLELVRPHLSAGVPLQQAFARLAARLG